MKSRFLVILFLAVCGGFLQAGTPREQSEAFLSSVLKGEINEGYETLFQGSFVAQAKAQQVEYLKSQTKTVLPMYGKMLGYEFISEIPSGSSVKRLVYVLKTEKHPLVWIFYYYCPADKWFLSTVFFNDEFKGLE